LAIFTADRLSILYRLGEFAWFSVLIVGKGLAPSGGDMFRIYAVFRRIRKISRVRIGFFVIY